MKRLLPVLLIASCAPSIDRAEDLSLRGLYRMGQAVDVSVRAVEIAREERMRACDHLEGKAARDCLGALAAPIAPSVEAFGKAYDEAVQAIQAMAEAARKIERMAKEANDARAP